MNVLHIHKTITQMSAIFPVCGYQFICCCNHNEITLNAEYSPTPTNIYELKYRHSYAKKTLEI